MPRVLRGVAWHRAPLAHVGPASSVAQICSVWTGVRVYPPVRARRLRFSDVKSFWGKLSGVKASWCRRSLGQEPVAPLHEPLHEMPTICDTQHNVFIFIHVSFEMYSVDRFNIYIHSSASKISYTISHRCKHKSI